MAGLDNYMLAVIRALAKNDFAEARKYALVCCVKDTTKKNQDTIAYYSNLLKNETPSLIKLPSNLEGLLKVENITEFNEERYYLNDERKDLLDRMKKCKEISEKMAFYGIRYNASLLIHGAPGTGKTEFARYTAYKLGIPFIYVNFSFLIDSYMGKTARNLQSIFDFCLGKECLLFIDEIDCIGSSRESKDGAEKELARVTISLMQALDQMNNNQILMAVTNRLDILDKALIRRFQTISEFLPYTKDEDIELIRQYVNSVDPKFLTEDMFSYAKIGEPQSSIIKNIIENIATQL